MNESEMGFLFLGVMLGAGGMFALLMVAFAAAKQDTPRKPYR